MLKSKSSKREPAVCPRCGDPGARDTIGRLRLLQQKARTTREHIQLVLALRRRREPRPDVFVVCADAIEQDVAT
jgi:hypothetical protein